MVRTRGGKSSRQSTRKSIACDSAQASHERAHNDTQALSQQTARLERKVAHNDTQALSQQTAHVTQGSIEPNIGISSGRKKRKVRGPTLMPKVWGQTEGTRKRISFNRFGQPNDKEHTSTFAHFLGTLARNGKYAPLNVLRWDKVSEKPNKEQMLQIVKDKFEIPLGCEDYILQSIGKKWRNWKSTHKTKYFDSKLSLDENLRNIPDRVNEAHWNALVKHWLSKEGIEASEKNKESRSHQSYTHHTGQRGFSIIHEMEHEKLGHEPSLSHMFMTCYSKKDSTPTNALVGEKIEQMKMLHSGASSDNGNDAYYKVMGNGKSGRVNLYGLGVKAADINGTIPSRKASHRAALELQARNEQLQKELNELRSIVSENRMQGNPSDSSIALSPNNHVQAATSVTQSPIEVGMDVVLLSITNPSQKVALGKVCSVDPSTKVGDEELGPNWCEVNVQIPIVWEERLIRSYGSFKIMGDVTGASIAWPLSLLLVDHGENHF